MNLNPYHDVAYYLKGIHLSFFYCVRTFNCNEIVNLETKKSICLNEVMLFYLLALLIGISYNRIIFLSNVAYSFCYLRNNTTIVWIKSHPNYLFHIMN